MEGYGVGMMARSLAGHDKGKVYMVLDVKEPFVYLLDILLSGSMEERACVVAEYGKEVRKIEQRISEFTASHPAGRHERSRSLSAGAER